MSKISKSRVLLICAVMTLLLVVLNATGADKKLTDYVQLIQSQWATNDVFVMVDVSANATKKTTVADFDERYFNVSSDLLNLATSVSGTLANANTTATALNTGSTIVARDSSGNFAAGTISAAISGNSTTATSLAANPTDCASDRYAFSINASGDLSCTTVTNAGLAGSIAASKLIGSDIATVGTITSGTWNATAHAISVGGTGATTKAAAFDALSPMTASGDLIYGGASGTGTRLPKGTDGYVLTLASGLPAWSAPTGGSAGAVTSKTANYTATGSDGTILVDPTGGDFTITLPAAASNTGLIYHITKTVSGNSVIIDPNSSETVCGQSTIRLVKNYETVDIQSNGTNWVGLGESCFRSCAQWTSAAGSITSSDGCTDSNPSKGTGLYTYAWKTGTFSALLYCNANGYGATTYRAHADSMSTSQARAVTISTSTLTDMDHQIYCYGRK